jgi:hypothetical protein
MERTPNALLLRHLRDAAWSDKGTARRVNGERLRRGRPTGYGGANVRGWLRGVQPEPLTREVLAFALSEALGRHVTQADLGFAGTDDPRIGLLWHESVSVTIDELITLWHATDSDGLALAPHGYTGPTRDWLLAWPEPAVAVAPSPSRREVGQAEVDVLWSACETYQEMERRVGGGHFRASVSHLLTGVVTPLLRSGYTEQVGRSLLAVAARLTDILGYAAYDGLDDGLAQRYLIQALRLARAAGDDALASHIFGDMARHATHIGDLREALALARAGQLAARAGGSDADLSRNACLEAAVLARLGLARDSAAAMSTAERALTTVDHSAAPAWVRYFTVEQMHGEFAHVASAGERYAEVLLFAATPMSAGTQERRKALLGTAVGRAYLGSGDVDSAHSAATSVLDLTDGMSSRRVAREVRTLCDSVAGRLPQHAAADLRRRSREVLAA